MKSKRSLIVALLQLALGVIAIVFYVFLGLGKVNAIKWIFTVILAIAFIVLGIIGLLE